MNRPLTIRLSFPRVGRVLPLTLAAALAACAAPVGTVQPDTSPLIAAASPSPTPFATLAQAPTASLLIVDATPTATPTPTPVPTPTVLTVKQAAVAYRAAAASFNGVVAAAEEKYGQVATLTADQRYWALIAAAAATFVRRVSVIRFPKVAAANAGALVKKVGVFRQLALMASKATDSFSWTSDTVNADTDESDCNGLAAVLRHHLGLPAPPPDYWGDTSSTF